MRPNTSLRWELCVVGVVGIGLSSIIIFFLISNLSAHGAIKADLIVANQALLNPNETASVIPLEKYEFPVRLKIPKIDIDAAIEQAGLTPDGAMDVPKDPANAAWFNLGPRPGEIGSAVIAGHFGRWKNGKGSVFDELHRLRKGDRIYVEDEQGATIIFVVREIRRYDPDADASEVFNSNDGKAHLNLITCEGAWDEISKSYSKRLVVFTDKEE